MSSTLLSFLALAGAAVATNDAIHANPDNVDIGLTTHGSDFLWFVFAVMLLSDLIFIAWTFKLPRGARIFHQIPIIILTTAAISYFSLASNLGNTGIEVEFTHAGRGTRAIWYVRYIDWVITTPLLLLELLLGTGLSLSDITTTVFFDLAMIVVGLVGALVASSYKWGYFTLGMFFEFYIFWMLIGPARTTAGLLGPEIRTAYTRSALILSGLWILYPIAWGLADGSNTISVTGEMVFYGVLDLLAKPVFCFLHVAALSKIPMEAFHLSAGNLHGETGKSGSYQQAQTGTTTGAAPGAHSKGMTDQTTATSVAA